MANFEPAYKLTMEVEGGYDNDPGDPGGETFKGVARNYNPHWKGWAIIDQIKTTHPQNLNAALNVDNELLSEVMAFYKSNYWNVNQTGLINDQQLANQVFDTAVNCGTGTTAKFLQQAAGVKVDKIIGSITLKAVNAANQTQLYNKFITLRKQHYLNLIAQNPKLGKFEKSWMSRLWAYKAA